MLNMLFLDNSLDRFLYHLIALLVAITVHECAHAWMANRLGDPTAKLAGRVTLNPIAHLDLWGTLFIFIAPFGWGKPVIIDPYNLADPRKDEAKIAIAGPAANFITAGVIALILRIFPHLIIGNTLGMMLMFILIFNISLGVFNLIPIFPLDGYKVVHGLLSPDQANEWLKLRQYGIFLLPLIMLPIFNGNSIIRAVIFPIINWIFTLMIGSAFL